MEAFKLYDITQNPTVHRSWVCFALTERIAMHGTGSAVALSIDTASGSFQPCAPEEEGRAEESCGSVRLLQEAVHEEDRA